MSKRNEGFGERKKRTKMAKKALTPHVNIGWLENISHISS
jgi:hypothetical protein